MGGCAFMDAAESEADKHFIASNITDTAFISHHSAFESHCFYKQVYDREGVSSLSGIGGFGLGSSLLIRSLRQHPIHISGI